MTAVAARAGHGARPRPRRRLDPVVARRRGRDAVTENDGRVGPLAGMRMIELGTLLAGPFAGRLLGDMGAEVIKVERRASPIPSATGARLATRAARCGGRSRRATRSASRSTSASGGARNSCSSSSGRVDVMTENFRPGTLERWNLGYERLSEVNPGLVLARISGYGQTGPYAERAGYASVAEAMGGLRYINGFPGQAPPRAASRSATRSPGCSPSRGPGRALPPRRARPRAGAGRRRLADGGVVRAPRERRARVRPARARPSADGHRAGGHRAVEHLSVPRQQVDGHRREPGRRLPPAVRGDGLPELADEPRSQRISQGARTRRSSRASSPSGRRSTTRGDRQHPQRCRRRLRPHLHDDRDLPRSAVQGARDAGRARRSRVRGVHRAGIVPKFSDTPGEVHWSGTWEEGSHNEEIYCGLLGLTDSELGGCRMMARMT